MSGSSHVDDVVAVEVTIDGMLVIADRLHMAEFPPALGIRPNIPQLELRDIVWDQVARDLTAQGVLDLFGAPHHGRSSLRARRSTPQRQPMLNTRPPMRWPASACVQL